MREQYLLERARQESRSRTTGVVLTVLMHAALVGCCFVTGFSYLYPPPPEKEMILIDFEEPVHIKPKQVRNGSKPQTEEPSKEIKLVQKSEAPLEGTKSNEAPESQVDDFGDVDIKDPEPKKEIDRRALFRSADNKTDKDTLAAQTARQVSDALKAGHAQGNTRIGQTDGTPQANLKGRHFVGTIPKPSYTVQAEGTVVVRIKVDGNGRVISAVPGYEGTTVNDNKLWQAARVAAMESHFNVNSSPIDQYGTITYIFRLK
jgi:TonB family protein